MKALLIAPENAAGLDPLAAVTPVPLLPLLGAPLVSPLLRRLAESGVTEVVLACKSRAAAYRRTLQDGRPWNIHLAVLELENVCSVSQTLDAVRARGFHDQTLAVLPADCWTDADWAALEAEHRRIGGGLSRISKGGAQIEILLVDPGVSLSSAPWRLIPADLRWRPVTTWVEYWALAKDSLENPRIGIAPPDKQASQVHLGPLARLDRENVRIEGAVWLGAGAQVDGGAVLRGPVWIGANCRVGPGVTLERCAIEAAAHLMGPLTLRNTLVVANRAIGLQDGRVAILDETQPSAPHSADEGMTAGLLQLATRTARRPSLLQEANR